MVGEDYQVFLSDGGACGPVLVWGYKEPIAGGKQGKIALLQISRIVPETCSVAAVKFASPSSSNSGPLQK